MYVASAGESSMIEFYVYGYETVQCRCGIQLIVNLSFKVHGEIKHVRHAFLNDKETMDFFNCIGIEPYNCSDIPGKSGVAEVTEMYDKYLITAWLKKGSL